MAQPLRGTITDNAGVPIATVEITVYLNGTATLATLYSDKALTQQTTNPQYTEADGSYLFYAADGSYDLVFEKDGVTFDASDSVDEICFDGPAHKTTSGHAASSIENTPAGGISATNVQAAINELDVEKMPATQRAAVSAYNSTSQTGLTSQTLVKVSFNAEIFDTTNSFASGRFTAPVAGKYGVKGQVTVRGESAAMTAVNLYVYVNGAIYADKRVSGSWPAGEDISFDFAPVDASLGASDYVEIYAFVDTVSGTWRIVGSGSKQTVFSLHYIAGA